MKKFYFILTAALLLSACEREDGAAVILQAAAAPAVEENEKKESPKLTTALDEISFEPAAPNAMGAWAAECLKTWAKSDIAILNADSFTRGFLPGVINEHDLQEAYPGNDRVMSVRFRGSELKRMLEGALLSKNNFPQIAGLSVEYAPGAPPYEKIKKIKINGSSVRGEHIYRMATSDAVIAGSFGTEDFLNVVEFKNTQVNVRVVLRQCLLRARGISAAQDLGWARV